MRWTEMKKDEKRKEKRGVFWTFGVILRPTRLFDAFGFTFHRQLGAKSLLKLGYPYLILAPYMEYCEVCIMRFITRYYSCMIQTIQTIQTLVFTNVV